MNSNPTIYSHDIKADATVYSDNQTEAASTPSPLPDPDFYSIDGPIQHWSMRFPIAMLRVGRILLKNESEVMNVSAAKISRLMTRHSNEIPEYSGLEIRNQVHLLCGEIRGGGIVVGWTEDSNRPHRSVPHYDFTFSHIYREDD
jgi:hypothetical protein